MLVFLRKQIVNNHGAQYEYLRIVESVREKGRPVQKTLVNLGNTDKWDEPKLQQLIGILNDYLGNPLEMAPAGLSLGDVHYGDCRLLGPYLPLAHLWDRLGMDAILSRALGVRKVHSSFTQCVKAMTLVRLVRPRSKKALWEMLGRDTEIPGVSAQDISLQGCYRALSYLDQAKDAVEKDVQQQLTHLFNQDVSLVFYDLTSAYFEGTSCPRAKRGYSREHRSDLLQIEIGLLVDAEGIPIGHEVFDGNVKDVKTVIGTLERLKKTFGVNRCVFVGDDGMASIDNFHEIEQHGYEYITSLSLGHSKIADSLCQNVRRPLEWSKLRDNLCMRSLAQEGTCRYIGAYNPERARSSRRHRKEHLRACLTHLRHLQKGPKPHGRKLTPEEQLISAQNILRIKGCSHLMQAVLTPERRLTWTLDRAAWRLDTHRDGLMILRTNSKTLSDDEVAIGYRTLWRAENAFRSIKDTMRLRPIRHWNDSRVLGHVFVCVLAYMLQRLFERDLEKAGLPLSAQAALDELNNIVIATLEAHGQTLRRRSEITVRQRKILAAVGLSVVPEIW